MPDLTHHQNGGLERKHRHEVDFGLTIYGNSCF